MTGFRESSFERCFSCRLIETRTNLFCSTLKHDRHRCCCNGHQRQQVASSDEDFLGDSGADASLSLDSESFTSYEADSPVSAYASVDASSDSALADTSVSLVAAASSDAESDYSSSDSASERVEVEQAHSLKEAFRPGRGLFRWFGLGKSSPRLWFLGRMPTYAMYDSSDYAYASSVGDLTYSASETVYSHAYLSIPIHHPSRDLRNYSASHPSLGL